MSTARLIHTNCGPGCGLVTTSVTRWPQGKNRERGELLRVQLSSSENSFSHKEAHVFAHRCFRADNAFHEITWFSGQCCTLLSLQHTGCFSLPQEADECTNPRLPLAIRYNPFLMHSRILLRQASNHTSVPPRLHPAPGLQRG